jgi:hypothetical protein
MVFKWFEKGWVAYRRNFGAFIAAILLLVIAVGAIALLAFASIALTLGIGIAGLAGAVTGTPAQLLALLAGLGFGMAMGILLLLVIAGLIGIVLEAGIIKMTAEALVGKTSWRTMFITARKRALPAIVAAVLVSIILLLIGLIPIAGVIIIFLLLPLFVFAMQAVVIDNLGGVDAVRRSIVVGKANYLTVLALVLLSALLGLITLIPIIGFVIYLFVLMPIIWATFTAFYQAKKRRR